MVQNGAKRTKVQKRYKRVQIGTKIVQNGTSWYKKVQKKVQEGTRRYKKVQKGTKRCKKVQKDH